MLKNETRSFFFRTNFSIYKKQNRICINNSKVRIFHDENEEFTRRLLDYHEQEQARNKTIDG